MLELITTLNSSSPNHQLVAVLATLLPVKQNTGPHPFSTQHSLRQYNDEVSKLHTWISIRGGGQVFYQIKLAYFSTYFSPWPPPTPHRNTHKVEYMPIMWFPCVLIKYHGIRFSIITEHVTRRVCIVTHLQFTQVQCKYFRVHLYTG